MLQEPLTILKLSDDALIEIARGIPLPLNIEALNTKFWKLKLSKYQPIVVRSMHGNSTEYIEHVFNQKRSRINVRTLKYSDMTTYMLKEFTINASLTSINLSYNNLGPKDAKYVAEGIAVSASLTSIDLSMNFIDSEGAKYVAEGIAVSASLTSIDLSNNNFSDEGAKHIAEGITVSASLTSIDLAQNKIGAVGAKHIAKAIAVSASLTQVLAF